MYQLRFVETKDKKFNHYKIENNQGTEMTLFSEYGASMMHLKLQGKCLVNNLQYSTSGALSFLNSSCSVVLFPFANRIKDGRYQFNDKPYQLDCNENKLGHALHGLVQKASFELKEVNTDKEQAVLSFVRKETQPPAGFPFPFVIELQYTLRDASVQLRVKVSNIGGKEFPFSLGWHPYFHSSNLEKSSLEIDSRQKIVNDARMIPQSVVDSVFPNPLLLRNQAFDNSFFLEHNKVVYRTPNYTLALETQGDDKQQFIHFYIPDHRQSIAIEPMTAAADCFNNGIGTKVLAPGAEYSLDWLVQLLP